jgi:class 3 adenylate cyclase
MPDVGVPETRYATAEDGVQLAYQVFGDGPFDQAWIHGFMGGLEVVWEYPPFVALQTRLASLSRVIRHDMRATGLSDRATSLPDLETQVRDARVVLDAAGSHSTVLVGVGGGGHVVSLFAVTYPRRTRALVLFSTVGRETRTDDYPWGRSEEEVSRELRQIASGWGTQAYAAANVAENQPSNPLDREAIAWYAKMLRHWVTPGAALELCRRQYEFDARDILRSVRVPTLVLARHWDDPEQDEYVASLIPEARLVRLPGDEGASMAGDQESLVAAIREFVGARSPTMTDSVLKTVLFTDIVGSTERQAVLGDQSWKLLLERHHQFVRDMLRHHGGEEIDTAGDGFYATFDSPARAIRCALSIVKRASQLSLVLRAGLHAGEAVPIDRKVGGIAVTIGSRVAGLAGPSEVLVSQTVRDLVVGSTIAFEDAGEHELKGVPGRWHLYRVME